MIILERNVRVSNIKRRSPASCQVNIFEKKKSFDGTFESEALIEKAYRLKSIKNPKC